MGFVSQYAPTTVLPINGKHGLAIWLVFLGVLLAFITLHRYPHHSWRQRTCCGNAASTAAAVNQPSAADTKLATNSTMPDDYATDGRNAETYWQKWALLEQRRLREHSRARLLQAKRLEPGPLPAVVAYRPTNGTPDVQYIHVFGAGLGARTDKGRWVSGHLFAPLDCPQSLPRIEQIVPCQAGSTCSFHIQALDTTRQPAKVAADELVFRARLFGDFLVPVEIRFNSTTKLYDASYTATDPGHFIIEVFLAWISHAGAGDTESYSYDEKQPPLPFGRVVFRTSHLLHVTPASTAAAVVEPSPSQAIASVGSSRDLGGEHQIQLPTPRPAATTAAAAAAAALPPLSQPSTPLCHSRSMSIPDAPGRWVYLPDGQCHPPHCSGSSLQAAEVSDKLGLNEHYIWAPLGCHLHLYNASELLTCAQGCGYKRWSFFGDSVGREQLQNLELLATSFQPTFSMPKLKKAAVVQHIDIKQASSTSSGGGAAAAAAAAGGGGGGGGSAGPHTIATNTSLEMRWQQSGGDVEVMQLSDPHVLMDHPLLDTQAKAKYQQKLSDFATACHNRAEPAQACIYYAPVTVQREADWARGAWAGPPAALKAITYPRMQQLHAWGVAHARRLGLTVLDGGAMTDAHWWSSWDGLHYSEMGSHFEQQAAGTAGNSHWDGGTSAMITQVLLNHLCNRPCNPWMRPA